MPKGEGRGYAGVIDSAHSFDGIGRRFRWYYSGSEERGNATGLYTKACEVALEVYGVGSERREDSVRRGDRRKWCGRASLWAHEREETDRRWKVGVSGWCGR